MSKRAYNDHLKQILKAAEENAEELMQEAAKQLIDLVETKSPVRIEIVDYERVANVAATIDGTWKKERTFLQDWSCFCHFSIDWAYS